MVLMSLYEETPESFASPSSLPTHVHQEKAMQEGGHLQARKNFLTESARTLIFNFPPSRIIRNKCQSRKPPVWLLL